MSTKKATKTTQKQPAHGGCSASTCSAGWLPPESAPLNGTLILGDFGWPWPLPAVWDTYDEQWCIATLQASPMVDGPTNSWIETYTEKRGSFKRWMPLPSLPNAEPIRAGVDSETN